MAGRQVDGKGRPQFEHGGRQGASRGLAGIMDDKSVGGEDIHDPLGQEGAAEPVVKTDHAAPGLGLCQTIDTEGFGQSRLCLQTTVHLDDGRRHQAY